MMDQITGQIEKKLTLKTCLSAVIVKNSAAKSF